MYFYNGVIRISCRPAFAVFFALLSTNSINFTKIVDAEDAKLSAEGREGEFLCGLCENLCALCV